MRLVLVTLLGLFVLVGSASVPAGATLAAATAEYGMAQQPPLEADIDVDLGGDAGAWWQNPVWIAIGVIGVILLVLIVAMVARGGGTTVVKE